MNTVVCLSTHIHTLLYISPARETMFLTSADLSDNICGTSSYAIQPDTMVSHRTPFTEDVP